MTPERDGESEARDAAEKRACEVFPVPWNDHSKMKVNRQNFAGAYLEGWNAALERAAQECRKYAHSGQVSMMRRQVAYACERRVRDLKESP